MSEPGHGLLDALGWTPARAAALTLTDGQRPVRIIEQHRSEYRVHDGASEFTARTHPALHKAQTAAGEGLAVGDWAVFQDEGAWLVQALPRTSLLERQREDGRRQRLVANVDVALLVMGLDGDYDAERLARYQQMAVASGVAPVILLTKADRVPEPEAQRAVIQAQAGAEVPVLLLDPRNASAQAALAPWLQTGRTLALLGSSGVGKSSLMNSLLGHERQRTGETQVLDDLGRHTTTARSLRLLPCGACLIDTPGMRELQLAPEQVADDFADVRALAGQCRFSDCRHEREPGCAVLREISAERMVAYRESLVPKAAPFRRGKR